MTVTTAQFLVGSTFDKVICDAAQKPNDSDVFQLVDKQWIQPFLKQQVVFVVVYQIKKLIFNNLVSTLSANIRL